VKLVLDESDGPALAATVAGRRLTTSALSEVEVSRAVWRSQGSPQPKEISELFTRVSLLEVSGPVLQAAAQLGPYGLRSLDTIHVSTAALLGDDVEALVTYDKRMVDAASAAGIATLSPA
jgi:predicted nucleic acid-binding protein